MKLVKSKCEKAWLFNTAKRSDEIIAGLACFLPGCEESVQVEMGGKEWHAMVPAKAVNSPVPVKVTNARLSLLISASHE
jgi:hypothetical protein